MIFLICHTYVIQIIKSLAKILSEFRQLNEPTSLKMLSGSRQLVSGKLNYLNISKRKITLSS